VAQHSDYTVEFLDGPDRSDGQADLSVPPPLHRPDDVAGVPLLWTPRPYAAYAAVALWAGAAVLLCLAPGRPLYASSFIDTVQDFPLHVRSGWDGWGDPLGGNAGDGPRYGIALLACAGLFAMLVVFVLVSTVRRIPRTPLLTAAVAVPALLAGFVLVLGLGVRGKVPDYTGMNFSEGPPTDVLDNMPTGGGFGSSLLITFDGPSLGGCFWLSAAALVAAVLGTATYLTGPTLSRRFFANRTAVARAG
jgi:hypothetical protein